MCCACGGGGIKEAQLQKLWAADGSANDRFGYYVAVSSDGARVVAGADGDDDPDASGSVYVFDGATGAQLLKLRAADGAARDRLGCTVAVSSDGARVVTGAHYDDGVGIWTGSAYVFDGATGAQLLKLRAADGGATDTFGWGVAVSSDGARVVVGAYYDQDWGWASGSAYVFDGVTGAQLLKLRAADGFTNDRFARSLAVSSDGARVVVGAPYDDDVGSDSGSVYVFDGATGERLLKLFAADGVAYDYFGRVVAVSSDGARVVAGAFDDDDAGVTSGSAYVFDGATGAQLLKLRAADGAAYDRFGWSVDVSSDGALVVVGAHYDDDDELGSSVGSAYVFDGVTGAQLQKLRAADGVTQAQFGRSVAVSSDGTRVVVGALYQNSMRGSVYVFGLPTPVSTTPHTTTFTSASTSTSTTPHTSTSTSASTATTSTTPHTTTFTFTSTPTATTHTSTSTSTSTATTSTTPHTTTFTFTSTSTATTHTSTFTSTSTATTSTTPHTTTFTSTSISTATTHSSTLTFTFTATTRTTSHTATFTSTSISTSTPATTLLKLELLYTVAANDGAAGDCFGRAVAVSSDGAHVVVGALTDNGKWGSETSLAHVFDGATGAQMHELVAVAAGSDGPPVRFCTSGDRFGFSVAVSSDGARVAVGAGWSSSAYVFDGATGAHLHSWDQGNQCEAEFGWSVAMNSDGALLVVGAPGPGPSRNGPGFVCVFDGATGAQLHKLVAEDGGANDRFGMSVAMSSDGARVAVGAYYDDSATGSAYLFDGATGAQLRKLMAEDGARWDFFGISVAVSSDGARVAVGAYYDDSATRSETGSAYVFDGATGAQLRKLVAEDGTADDRFGISVTLSSDGARVAVGVLNWWKGSAYLFDGATGAQLYSWALREKHSDFGWSVAMSSDGTRVVVGAPGQGHDGNSPGFAYVFGVLPDTPTASSTAAAAATNTDTASETSTFDVASVVVIAAIVCLICCALCASPRLLSVRRVARGVLSRT